MVYAHVFSFIRPPNKECNTVHHQQYVQMQDVEKHRDRAKGVEKRKLRIFNALESKQQ